MTPRQAPADLHTTFPAAAVAILEVTTVPDPDGWLIRDVALGDLRHRLELLLTHE